MMPAAPDVVTWVEGTLIDPETDALFILTDTERHFLRYALKLDQSGRLLYPEQVFSAPKKTGKTALAAIIIIYAVRVLGGRFAEGYCVANDFEQAQGRVFTAVSRIVAASPVLAADAVMTADKIVFASTGATIAAIASDFAGAAGAAPTITSFDELWGYTSERAHRLWDEMIPVPTRKISLRLTTTYAGFEGESTLLESLHKRGLQGQQVEPDLYVQDGMLMFWTNRFTAPWQTEEWREQMRAQLRPNAYLRLIENRWVTSESTFLDMAWWDACTDPGVRPVLADRRLEVWVGVDASVKRDSTAIVACAWDEKAKQARLVWHRVFQPSPTDPLEFETTIEATLRELVQRFRVAEIRFDPYQMAAVAQRLTRDRVPMVEFPQTVPNLTAASSNLYELVKGRNIVTYPDDDLRLAVQRSVAIETSRGWRIAKEKASHKIDVVVALAQAALGATQSGQGSSSMASWHKLGTSNGFARFEAACGVGPPPPQPPTPEQAAAATAHREAAQGREAMLEAQRQWSTGGCLKPERLRRGDEPMTVFRFARPCKVNDGKFIAYFPAGDWSVPMRLAEQHRAWLSAFGATLVRDAPPEPEPAMPAAPPPPKSALPMLGLVIH